MMPSFAPDERRPPSLVASLTPGTAVGDINPREREEPKWSGDSLSLRKREAAKGLSPQIFIKLCLLMLKLVSQPIHGSELGLNL